jgi:hypothetical protein
MTAINKPPGRHEIEELLPWHATGTLSRHDADRVEQALADSHELPRRYELVRQELAGTVHLNETIGAPSARAMEKLFAAINAEEARAITSSASASNRSGTVMASDRAVCVLITTSKLVGCITGKSAGLVPFKILPA